MSIFKPVLLLLSPVLLIMVAVAQQPTAPTAPENQAGRERPGKRHQGMQQRGAPGLRLGRILDLSDAQREQMQAIVLANMETTKPQREELFSLRQKRLDGTLTAEDEGRVKILREQLRQSAENNRAQLEALLTPEQKAQLETFHSEHLKRRGEFRERRQERRQERRVEQPNPKP